MRRLYDLRWSKSKRDLNSPFAISTKFIHVGRDAFLSSITSLAAALFQVPISTILISKAAKHSLLPDYFPDILMSEKKPIEALTFE